MDLLLDYIICYARQRKCLGGMPGVKMENLGKIGVLHVYIYYITLV